jgi:predicted dehydrogenase
MIKVGIIGAHVGSGKSAGSWGMRAHAPALQALPDFEITAIANSRLETARETASQLGVRHAFGEPAELAVHPDVDVVAICVRVPEHARLVRLAAEAGKHIYCEWPLARDTAEATTLEALVRARGVTAMIGLQGRYAPAARYLRNLIAAGEIGEVRAVSLNHSVPWPTTTSSSMTYLQTEVSGANYLTIPGAHTLDLFEFLVGGFERFAAVTRVQNPEIAIRDTGETMRRDTPDQIAMMGVLEQSGAIAIMRFQGASSPGGGIVMEINGSRGDLRITPYSSQASMMQIWDLRIERTTALGTYEKVEVPQDYFRVAADSVPGPALNVAHAWLEFAAALEQGRSPSPDFSDAVRLHRWLDGVRASSAATKWVDGVGS